MKHVDIVRNDWFNGDQRLAARVSKNDKGLHIESFAEGDWFALLDRPLVDQKTNARVSPEEAPEHYLALLHDAWDGSYYFATELHDDDHCSFGDANAPVPMTSTKAEA